MIHTTWLYCAVPPTPHGEVAGIFFEVAPLDTEAIELSNSTITANPHVNLRIVTVPFWLYLN
jgi:hypothetical protein